MSTTAIARSPEWRLINDKSINSSSPTSIETDQRKPRAQT